MWREWNVRLECASREKVECRVGRESGVESVSMERMK